MSPLPSPKVVNGLAWAALPETERRESPAARQAAAMILMEVIGVRGMRRALFFGHGLTISAPAATRDDLHLFPL